MTVAEFMKALEALYPKASACSWDNDGLMCCDDLNREVKKVLVSLDGTKAAIQAAAKGGYDLLLTHHPMVFRGSKTVTPEDLVGARTIEAVKSGVSVISLHTRLDAGEEGVNELLAKKLCLTNVRPFGPADCPTLGRIGEVPLYSSLSYDYFYPTVKVKLNAPFIQVLGNRRVIRVAVVGGAGSDFIEPAIREGADTLVTGEMGYNTMEDAAEKGLNIILGGHYFTEAPVLERLESLAKEIAGAEVGRYCSNPVLVY